MGRIDTSTWSTFIIEDLFVKVDLQIKKEKFSKAFDVSIEKTDEFSLPLVNAKDGNNGIMYYGRPEDFESEIMCLDIVKNGAVATGNVYAQPQATGVLWDAYLIKPKAEISEYALLFLARVVQNVIKKKYSYDDKAIWQKVKSEAIKLPVDQTGRPDFSYMETYMKNRAVAVSSALTALQSAQKLEFFKRLDTKDWAEFRIKELFDVRRPAARSQADYSDGTVPFVASGNYNNGVLKYLQPNNDEPLEQGGCITVSPVDGSAFYQEKPFLGRGGAGSSIILLYNSALNLYSGYFIATVIRSVCSKYAYSDMANKETISDEVIKLPVDDKNQPDYQLMSDYMVSILKKKRRTLQGLRTCV